MHGSGTREPAVDRFTVAATMGAWSGGGQLEVRPGSLHLVAGPILRRLASRSEILHTESSVRFVRARLMPPWINTSLILVGQDRRDGLASVPVWLRRRLRHSLVRAGFDIVDVNLWLSLGDKLLRNP